MIQWVIWEKQRFSFLHDALLIDFDAFGLIHRLYCPWKYEWWFWEEQKQNGMETAIVSLASDEISRKFIFERKESLVEHGA